MFKELERKKKTYSGCKVERLSISTQTIGNTQKKNLNSNTHSKDYQQLAVIKS